MTLSEYVDASWSDVIADRADEVGSALRDHLERGPRLPDVTVAPESGLVDGIRYEARGGGPPLVLLPLGLAPSQWEPVIEGLSENFCTITLGGAELGMVAQLEERARSVWYQGMLRDLVAATGLQAGQRVLEVGCGGGTVLRWLARQTAGANPIVGVDVNRYLLREARALVEEQALAGSIQLREGDAQHLPLQDGEFDLTLCITVLEEGDADRMLREIVRVTRPGGHVAIMVRSIDMPWWVNIPVSDEIKAKAGRWRRVVWPRMAALTRAWHDECARRDWKLSIFALGSRRLSAAHGLRRRWHGYALSSIRVSWPNGKWPSMPPRGRGSLSIAQPYYCAVGTKP